MSWGKKKKQGMSASKLSQDLDSEVSFQISTQKLQIFKSKTAPKK